MMSKLCLGLLALTGVTAVEYTSSQLGDEVTDLPGLDHAPAFKMFAGYVPVDEAKTRQIFYWFVEAQNNPESAPVVLWTNGGPGCSGLGGFMTEMGPFRATQDSRLMKNPHSWNIDANMIFIEQPAGVGFSMAPADYKDYGDDNAAMDNYNFVVNWFKMFPQFADRPFYTTSESYGGHYMPTLALQMVNGGGVPQYKGFAVGNPLTYMPYRDFGQYGTLYGHQLLPKPLFEKYLDAGCDKDDSSDTCGSLMEEMDTLSMDMDPYALDFPICLNSAKAAGRNERAALLKVIRRSGRHTLKGYFPDDYEPCSDDYGAAYLNRPDVQAAIHVMGNVTWEDCNMAINEGYNITDVNAPMMPVYKALIESGKNLDILVYSGDDDSVCATLGTQQWLWDLGQDITDDWAPWHHEGQLAGFKTEFKGLNFVTVHGAGHMVPSTRPAQGLALFRAFLNGTF